MQYDDIRNEIHGFIHKNFIYSDTKQLKDDESLLGSGVVDSTGVLELIAFLELTFGVKFEDSDLIAANFDSIARIIAIVTEKAASLI